MKHRQIKSFMVRRITVGVLCCIAAAMQSCAFLINGTSDKTFGSWQIAAGERVFMRDTSGNVKTRIVEKPQSVLLYTLDDTLFYHGVERSPAEQQTLFFAHNEAELRKNAAVYDTVRFRDAHFDIDFITIPFRFRFRQGMTLPPSGVASPFCGGLYAGWRMDAASHQIHLLPNQTLRSFTTTGLGVGVFTTFAPVYVSPWNTDYRTMVEYEGLGINYGAAFVWAYQGLTIGLLLGFEALADENSAIWVYHNKPWVGFSLGFNLN